VIGLSLALGPIVGGALVDSPLGWRGIFLINLPIGLAAIAVATKVTPESKAARPRKADPPGQALIALTLAGLVFGVIEGPQLGWSTAAGVSSATRQIGQTVGVAIAGVTLAAGSSSHSALASATHLGWTLNIGYGAAVLILGLLSTTAWAKKTAQAGIVSTLPHGDLSYAS
jgi:hypothetical protein